MGGGGGGGGGGTPGSMALESRELWGERWETARGMEVKLWDL